MERGASHSNSKLFVDYDRCRAHNYTRWGPIRIFMSVIELPNDTFAGTSGFDERKQSER